MTKSSLSSAAFPLIVALLSSHFAGAQPVELRSTGKVPAASGQLLLAIRDSGIVEASVIAHSLPDATSLGPYRVFIAWAATWNQRRVFELGPVVNDVRVTARLDSDSLLVFVSAEADSAVARWSGPIILAGRHP